MKTSMEIAKSYGIISIILLYLYQLYIVSIMKENGIDVIIPVILLISMVVLLGMGVLTFASKHYIINPSIYDVQSVILQYVFTSYINMIIFILMLFMAKQLTYSSLIPFVIFYLGLLAIYLNLEKEEWYERR